MAFVRSFNDFTPPARYDDEPYVQVVVQEAVDSDGPWEDIETIELEPPDADPAEPAAREFTTSNALLDPAWYRLVWEDASAGQAIEPPIHYGTFEGFITPDDVARVLGLEQVPSDQLSSVSFSLQAAIEWAKLYLNDPSLGASGDQSYTFYDVHNNVDLPVGFSVSEVQTENVPNAGLTTLTVDKWYVDTGNRLTLVDRYGDLGLPPEETRWNRRWHRVVVEGEAPESINAMIRQGIAIAATAVHTRQSAAGRGVTSENLGDYSYTLASAASNGFGGDPFFAEAKALLQPFRLGRVTVVP